MSLRNNKRKGRGTSKGKIKAKNPEDPIKNLKDHFRNLLEQSSTITSKPTRIVFQFARPFNTHNFTMEEIKKCIRGFKYNEAPGLYNIPIEFWKTGALRVPLLEACSKILNWGKAEIWVNTRIVPLTKKEDLGDTGNYRGISLTVAVAKIYNKLLLNGIRPYLDPALRINQNCFYPGRSILSQILEDW